MREWLKRDLMILLEKSEELREILKDVKNLTNIEYTDDLCVYCSLDIHKCGVRGVDNEGGRFENCHPPELYDEKSLYINAWECGERFSNEKREGECGIDIISKNFNPEKVEEIIFCAFLQ